MASYLAIGRPLTYTVAFQVRHQPHLPPVQRLPMMVLYFELVLHLKVHLSPFDVCDTIFKLVFVTRYLFMYYSFVPVGAEKSKAVTETFPLSRFCYNAGCKRPIRHQT